MPALNRFYNPSQSKYQSQFVPENLPVDLMAKTLYAKQGKADRMMAATIELGEWDQVALGDHDTNYIKGIKSEVEKFTQDSMNEDRTSPEFQRKYLELTNKIKKDPNIAKVQAAVDNYEAYQTLHAEYVKAGKGAQADALEADYEYRLNEYTKKGGEGFNGMALGDANIQRGTNIYKDSMEFFTPLKADGADAIKFLGSGISYKNGWVGIGKGKVTEQADRQFGLWENTDAGKQQRQVELQKLGLVDTTYGQLTDAQRKEVDNRLDTSLRNKFLDIGRSVIHGKSTTNIDGAYNADRTEEKESEVVLPTAETTYSKDSDGRTAQEVIDDKRKAAKELKNKIWQDKLKIKNEGVSGYSKEAIIQMRKQYQNLEKEADLIQEQSQSIYSNTYNAQIEKKKSTTQAHEAKQVESLAILKANLSEKDYASIASLVSGTDFQGAEHNSIRLDGVLKQLEDGPVKVAVTAINDAEKYKFKLDGLAQAIGRNVYSREAQKPLVSTSEITTRGVTVRTDKNSTLFKINEDIKNNSSSYNLYDANGVPIDYNAIVDFKGSSITSSEFRDKGDNAISGRMKIIRNKINPETGEPLVIKGVIQTEAVIVEVNAVAPAGTTGFIKKSIAKEQLGVYVDKSSRGKNDEAAVAFSSGIALNNEHLTNELVGFQSSDTPTTAITLTAISPDRRTIEDVTIGVTKIDAGGYRVNSGNHTHEFATIEAVNGFIQVLTNSVDPNTK